MPEQDALDQRILQKTELHKQINDLYRQLDALDASPTPEDSAAQVEPEPLAIPDPAPHFADASVAQEEDGAAMHAHDHTEGKTIYAAPDSNDTSLLKALVGKLKHGLKPGQQVVKTADGPRLMLIVTSNSYKDRESETLTSAALKADVDRHWTQGDDVFMSNNKLLYWHDDDIEVGDIVWGDMVGPFYVEVARELDTPISKAYFNYREANPAEKWGASHRFAYYRDQRSQDGDYHRIFKKETTTLPLDAAANLITLSEVIPMSDKRAKKFDEIMGLDGAHALLKTEGFDALVKRLAEQGIEHKALNRDEGAEGTEESAAKFLNLLQAITEDHVALAEDMDGAVKSLDERRKAYEDKAAELDSAVKQVKELAAQLQAQLDARPRSASRASETLIENKDLDADVADALMVKDPVFGKVKRVRE